MSNTSILQNPHYYDEPSVFKPENLLREARRQLSRPDNGIPDICLLDPDGDLVNYLRKEEQANSVESWAGYHTTMYRFQLGNQEIGVIGCAVGAPFAVLVAEQAFASGCRLLLSITSAGTIIPPVENARFLLIKQALRDEGTSHHYLSPEKPSRLEPGLLNDLQPLQSDPELSLGVGLSWTTDAPYRETRSAIEQAKSRQVNAVEMEAAALYAFGQFHQKPVICFAHLTNTMAQQENDFEKGPEAGSIASLTLLEKVLATLPVP